MFALPKSLFLAYMYTFTGENEKAKEAYDAARIDLEKEVQIWPEDPRNHSSLGSAYAGLGRSSDAVREGKLAVDLLPMTRDAYYGIAYEFDLAAIYSMTGDLDAALKKIEYLFSIPSWMSPAWMSIDPRFHSVYSHPGWPEVKRKYLEKYK